MTRPSSRPALATACDSDLAEVTVTVKEVLDLWVGAECSMPDSPVADYVADAVWYLSRAPRFGGADAARHETAQIGESARADIRAYESAQRVSKHCGACPYYGYCPGRFVAQANGARQQSLAQTGCPVRNTIQQIVVRSRPRRVVGILLPLPGSRNRSRDFAIASI